MNRVLRHLRRAALRCAGEGLTDAQLLDAFISQRDEAAFETMLRRHGPMVLGVCRRVLRNDADAEDSFQATFLVLARKAGSVRSREVLAGWLYGVAYRTSTKARAMNTKRRTREREARGAARLPAPRDGALDELLERLDAELHRLPDRYRVPVVLCELEGKSRKEAARTLGLAEGTLSWRLAQARKLLARKLSRHGAALSAGAVAAALAQGVTTARPSASLLSTTARNVVTAGPVPAKVVALTEGVIKAMFLSKLKVAGLAVVLAAVGAGTAGLTYRARAQEARPVRNNVAQEAPLGARPKVQAAADDLDSLRLEIEALRRELRATRDRVKALEAKVQGPGGAVHSYGYGRYDQPAAKGPANEYQPEKPKSPYGAAKLPTDLPRKKATDPLTEIQEAASRLRKNPADKEAADALERSVRRLKEQPKPGVQYYPLVK